MVKKTISLILASLALFLSGCGSGSLERNHSSAQSTQIESTEVIIETDSPTVRTTTVPTEKATEDMSYDTEWTKISYSSEDSDGYTFDISVELSPWVLLSNTDIVNSIWKEVSAGQQLPSFNDWGLNLYNSSGFNNFYERNNENVMFFHTMTDMYYCIGSATIKNTTNGWDISEQNPRQITESLFCSLNVNDVNSGGSSIICKTFYNDGIKDYGGVTIEGTMKGNIVTIPFIIMAPENISPKYTNGEYYEVVKDSVFYEDWSSMQNRTNGNKIGIIGKDAIYIYP